MASRPPNPVAAARISDLRKQCLAILVKLVRDEFGFPIYRNPEYRGENGGPMTACRLVGEEFGLSERTVEEIWADRKAGIEAASAAAP